MIESKIIGLEIIGLGWVRNDRVRIDQVRNDRGIEMLVNPEKHYNTTTLSQYIWKLKTLKSQNL